MSSKGGVIVVVSGEDKTGEVFAAVKRHMEETSTAGGKMQSSIEETARGIQNSFTVIRDAFVLDRAFVKIKEMISTTVDLGMEIGHLSQQTGISAQNLSVLRYTSQQTGVEFETLTKGFKKLSTSIFEWQHGEKLAGEAFGDLHISMADINAAGNDMYKVMELVADRFQKMPDGIHKNALATQLFGRAGQSLIPILNQGSAGLAQFRGEAESLGVVLDEAGVQKMEDLHRSGVKLQATMEGLGLTLTNSLAPALENMARLIPSVLGIGGQGPHGNDFAAGIQAINDWADAWVHGIAKAGYAIGTFAIPDMPAFEKLFPGHNSENDLPPAGTRANKFLDYMRSGKAPGAGEDPVTGAAGKPAKEYYPDRSDDLFKLFGLPFQNKDIQAAVQRIKDAQQDLADATADAAQRAQAAWDAAGQVGAAQANAIFGADKKPNISLAPKPFLDADAVSGEAEKFAHGVFDPLFSFGEKWDKEWKQIKANMLRDLGQFAESQLFGALFGDPQGRGGKGWNGSSYQGNTSKPGRGGIGGATGIVGGLLGMFTGKPSAVTSNGGMGSGAGTIPSMAASVMQMGKGGPGAAPGGIQVVINNQGPPMTVTQTQQSQAAGNGAEQTVIQIIMKQLETNGPVAQGIMGLIPGL